GDAVPNPLEERLIERRERDRLPHPRPSFVPCFDPDIRSETPANGALACAERSKKTSVRERIGFEVQSDLDDGEPVAYPSLVMKLLVAGPELSHVRIRRRMNRWEVRGNLLLDSLDDAAETGPRIELTDSGRVARGRH